MTRVKRGTTAHKRRKNLLKLAKGYKWRRKTHYRAAKEAVLHAGQHAFVGRKNKKREYRGIWITRLTAAAHLNGTSYSKMIGELKKGNVELNRKMLSEIALNHPEVFQKIISK